MKLQINKACDLNSISVLPPRSRRPNGIPSQLSQNSIDNNEQSQRFGSQERENSTHRISCLPPGFKFESTQSRRFGSQGRENSTHRISCLPPPSNAQNHHRCQVSDELEHRIGQIENTQNRQGIILESIQGDMIQVKKQMQECAMDIETIKQKLGGHEISLQLVLKGEEDINVILDASLKSLPGQFMEDLRQEIASLILKVQNQREEQILNLKAVLSGAFTSSVKAITSLWQTPDQKSVPSPPKSKDRDCQPTESQKVEPMVKSAVLPQKVYTRRKRKAENKAETRQSSRLKPNIPLVDLDEEWRENNELDEDLNCGFSYLLGQEDSGVRSSFFDVDQVDADLIFKKARRRNRKHGNVTEN